MCGLLGAWAPSGALERGDKGALKGLSLSRQLLEYTSREVGAPQIPQRLVARWSWREAPPRWGEVEEALGPSLLGALRSLAHRGPDGVGFYLSPCRGVWLAHTRLAVRGARGAQPLGASRELSVWSAEPTEPGAALSVESRELPLWAVINGELYEGEPRVELGELSDSARLLRAYQRDPTLKPDVTVGEAHRGLRGEYAFALWDEGLRRLTLGRDPFGVKPLCYAWRDGLLYFASETKALFALGLQPTWGRGALAHLLLHQYLPPQQSLFGGVSQLSPGATLRLEGGGHLELSEPSLDELYPSEGGASQGEERGERGVRGLRERLLEATALRLEADVPTCFQLSGGLDSCAVLGAARALGHQAPHAFSLAFDDPRYDEAPLAAQLAAELGARWERVDASTPRLMEALSDAVYYSEGVCINGQLPAKRLLCLAMRSSGARVCLSGEGADEALLGYPHLTRDAYPSALKQLSARQAQTAAIMLGETLTPIPALEEAWGYTPSFLSAKSALLAPLRSLFEGEGEALGFGPLNERSALWSTLPGALSLRGAPHTPLARARRSAWAWARLCLAGYILKGIGDGMEMSASIEGRPVYLDPRLFGLASRVATLKVGAEKAPLREAVRGLIPEQARLAPKRSLLSPPLGGVRGAEGGALERALAVDAVEWASIPSLSPQRVRRWLTRLWRASDEERARLDPSLCVLLSLYELQRRLHTPS